jgi:DNA primase
MIPREIVDKILQTALIEEVIGEFVQLKRSGSSLKGLSPFTTEKTPSFYVSPAKQIFKDFSSGKGGSVITFLMEHEHFTYPEALRWLADKYQIEIPEEAPSEAYLAEQNEREGLYIVNAFAQKFFTEQLWNGTEGKAIGLAYFRERGFTDATIQTFQLGYCPENDPHFFQTAFSAGHSADYLIKAGLIKEKDGRHFDFFRGRVMFPIQNLTGRVIAFGGRTLRSDKKIAKYFNSPESEIYHKSNVLYGIFQAKNSIVKSDLCLLVEGYTDVLAMHQAGVQNVVASSGTALTREQIRLIRRYTANVTILYDGDAAGIRASFRGIDLVLEEGMNVRIVLFPDGHDPDSFSRSVSEDELKEFISNHSRDFVSFKADILFNEAGKDPLARAEAIREIVESIAHIPDSITRSLFLKECSERFGIPEQSLISHHNKARRDLFKKSTPEAAREVDLLPLEEEHRPVQPVQAGGDLHYQESEIVRLLLNFGDQICHLPVVNDAGELEDEQLAVADFIIAELENDGLELSDPVLHQIMAEYIKVRGEQRFPELAMFASHHSEEVRNASVNLLAFPYALSDRWQNQHEIITRTEEDRLKEAVTRAIVSYKAHKISAMIAEVQEKLKTAGDTEFAELIEQNMSLKSIEMRLNQILGRDIIR